MTHLLPGQDLAQILATVCGVADPLALYGVIVALFAAGLVGGFAHCGPMCGPFVLMQVGASDSAMLGIRRLATGLLPAYHLGRIITYMGLGMVGGSIGAAFIEKSAFHGTLALLLGVAAFAFALQALNGARILPAFASTGFGNGLGGLIARVARPLLIVDARLPGAVRHLLLGLVLGFLPCGFLYAGLTAAAATGSSLGGVLAMAAFGLGTVPALAMVGMVGAGAREHWRRVARLALPAIFLLNAVTLGGIALRLAV